MLSSTRRRNSIRIPPKVPNLVRDESPFVTKGGTKAFQSGGTYERIRDPSGRDVIVVKGPNGNATINLDDVKATLQSLAAHSDTPIASLPPSAREDFNAMVEISRVAYNSAVYSLFIDEVLAAFQNVPSVREGTVGAFFKGCFVENKFEGPPGCDPRCAGSLPPSQGTPGWDYCDKPVIMYSSNGLTSLNDVSTGSSGDAYIVVNPNSLVNGQFPGFTTEEIRSLSSSGIKRVKIVYSSGDSYREYSNFVNVDSLPTSSRGRQDSPPAPQPINTGGDGWGALFLVLIVVIFLVIVVLLLTRTLKKG